MNVGRFFTFGIFTKAEQTVIGGSGIHRRIGDDGLEVGYWIREDRTREGLATEVARALTDAGFQDRRIRRIQIHCDPENIGSRRGPEKLGYDLVETRKGDKRSPDGSLRDTLVFEVVRPGLQ